jgi:predicted Zn-dependent protease
MKKKALLAFSASLAVLGFASQGLAQRAPRQLSQSASAQAAQQHPQIVAEFGGEETGARVAYVTSVGRKVAAHANVAGQGNAFRITTLNSPVMNAFAVPGGYVYITRQLLGLMDDEAELALVLGHEVGHIDARHSRGRERTGILTSVLAGLAGIVTGSSQIAQLAGQLGQGYLLSFSREQEYQADDLGIRYISRAGYDPNAAASMFASLGAATSLEQRAAGRNDERSTPSWARTHPLSEDRVRRATAQAQKTGLAGRGARNRDQFLAQIDGLLVGDDPRQGVIEGSDFLHPDLRLAFTAPQGYGMQNGSRSVTIAGSNGQAQFSTGQFNGNLSNYILAVYQGLVGQQAGQLQIPQPRETSVNGIPAAYTTTRMSTQQGQLDVSVFAYRWDADSAFHFVTITRAGAGIGPFASMVGSLRRLGTAEAQAIRPRVIDIVTVRAGDTVQSLANRMAYNDLRLERFLTLNSLSANTALRPGDKVKLVVYGTRQG